VLAISSDDGVTLLKFRTKYGRDVAFVSDPKGELIERYGVKTPVITFAQRTTFIIDQTGVIRAVQTGGDAIDVRNALKSVQALK
jgi:peroxiredoxin Q/BCP